jgi:hypothetical protein
MLLIIFILSDHKKTITDLSRCSVHCIGTTAVTEGRVSITTKAKAVPLHAVKALGGRGDTVLTRA